MFRRVLAYSCSRDFPSGLQLYATTTCLPAVVQHGAAGVVPGGRVGRPEIACPVHNRCMIGAISIGGSL